MTIIVRTIYDPEKHNVFVPQKLVLVTAALSMFAYSEWQKGFMLHAWRAIPVPLFFQHSSCTPIR